MRGLATSRELHLEGARDWRPLQKHLTRENQHVHYLLPEGLSARTPLYRFHNTHSLPIKLSHPGEDSRHLWILKYDIERKEGKLSTPPAHLEFSDCGRLMSEKVKSFYLVLIQSWINHWNETFFCCPETSQFTQGPDSDINILPVPSSAHSAYMSVHENWNLTKHAIFT